MFNSRLINTKVAGGGGGCTDIVDNYDPFGGSGVALYQLNGDATDESGNYNGTASNVTYGTGVFGQAGVFNGSSSKITLNNTLITTGDFSVSLWVKVNSAKSYSEGIISNNNETNNTGFAFVRNYVTQKFNFFTGNGAGSVYAISNDTVSLNTWYHIVLNYSGTTLTLYVNGAAQTTTGTATLANSNLDLILGTYSHIQTRFLDGSIDQVRIFNEALTPLEVEALYTEELCICDGTVDTLQILGDTSCIATYQLDGNANDLSGNYSGTPTDVSYGVGEFDLAGVFNGSSSSITTTNPTFNATTWSVSLWTKAPAQGVSFDIGVLWQIGAGLNLQIREVSSNTDSFYISDFSEEAMFYSGVVANQWYNITIVRNGSSFLHYVNGNLVLTRGYTNANTSDAFRFGNRTNGDWPFWGSIDQVRIFNKALSSSEVTTLYNETACTKVTRTAGATQILGDSSCVAYYKLDGDVTDETGTYDGSVVGTISYADGDFNYAADFDYSNNYINTNFPLLWDNVQGNITPITVSCWIKGQGYSGTGYGWIVMSGYGFYIAKSPNNEIQIQTISSTGGSLNLIKSSAILNNTDWFHIVGIWNFKTIKLYINGQFIGEDTGTDGFSGDQQITKNMLIGKWNLTSQNQGYLGQIDQFRVFNKEVSASEVTTLYNEGI